MTNATITVKKDDIKSILTINKVFTGIFILAILYFAFNGSNSIYYFAPILGIIISLISIYANKKSLKIKGNIISKTTTDIDTVKRNIVASKIFFIFFLIILGFVNLASLIADFNYFIGFFPFTVLILYGSYMKFKMLSNSLKKK